MKTKREKKIRKKIKKEMIGYEESIYNDAVRPSSRIITTEFRYYYLP